MILPIVWFVICAIVVGSMLYAVRQAFKDAANDRRATAPEPKEET